MKYTIHYNIPKPELLDNFNFENWHAIFDLIDSKVYQAETDIATFETDEANRVTAEGNRVTAENSRVTAEGGRATSETNRNNAESARTTSESGRVIAENNRVTAETGRTTAEGNRVTAENTRATQETTRQTNESTRQTQEGTRVSNETARNTEFASWRDTIENASLGDMQKIVYDQNVDGIVDSADVANHVPWTGITDNPITFTPENVASKGAVNGYAPLDSSGLIPLAYLPSSTSLKIVANITERNALTDHNAIVHVIDATGDATVTSGWAEYVWYDSGWVKTAESESMDVVLSWTNITGKPATFAPSDHNHVVQDLFFSVATTTNGQTQMTIPDATFDGTKHGLDLHRNGIPLNPSEDYTISGRTITFVEALVKNASVTMYIRMHITKILNVY